MHCPKDKIPCNTKQLEDINIDVCPKCDGVWMEQSEVRSLTRHISRPYLSYVDEILAEWEVVENKGTIPDDFWSEDKLVCSKDGTQMKKHYFAGSHIGVDQCHTCKGFWFDGGELHAVAKYFEPNPALDNAWQEFLRDKKEWREKVSNLSGIPTTMASFGLLFPASPTIAVMGSFIIKTIIDILVKDKLSDTI